jgi:hypothetical protein
MDLLQSCTAQTYIPMRKAPENRASRGDKEGNAFLTPQAVMV